MDDRKQPVFPYRPLAQIGSGTEPIRVGARLPAEQPSTDAPSESSTEVYCGNPQQVTLGFALALRAMGLAADIPEGGECLPSFSALKKDD